MVEVSASTEIGASLSSVWATLTDFARFRRWNPFIRNANGTAAIGNTIRLRVRPRRGVALAFRAKVVECEENRELHWDGHVLAPWLARGEHWFTLEPGKDGGVHFVQRERFSGLLPRLASRLLARHATRGFDAMNHALAREAEAREAARMRVVRAR